MYVATATAWYYNDNDKRKAAVNWGAVVPEVQGLGLEKAIIMSQIIMFICILKPGVMWQ